MPKVKKPLSGLKGYYEAVLELLIKEANEDGFVFTVTTVPGLPLAMGNYVMAAEVREVRS